MKSSNKLFLKMIGLFLENFQKLLGFFEIVWLILKGFDQF